MQTLFVDTSAWVAYYDSKDKFHAQAVEFMISVARQYRLVITNYILDETFTLLLANAGLQTTIKFRNRMTLLIKSGLLKVVWVDESLSEQAWKIFEQFNFDKFWSFTDCVSNATMQQLAIRDVFTFDQHFAQMGFAKLP